MGSRNQSSLAAEMLLENQAAAITQKCVSMALAGDATAIKLCLSRLIPIKRQRTVELGLPALEDAKGALGAINVILNAVGEGQITPSEGASITRLLEAHRAAFEIVELEHRIEALEAQQCAAAR